uniref:Uncharacterized protein n=1 Tax=Oryza rufipogon TaxID=4529 RepID=A0A0E0RIM2_ORYRU
MKASNALPRWAPVATDSPSTPLLSLFLSLARSPLSGPTPPRQLPGKSSDEEREEAVVRAAARSGSRAAEVELGTVDGLEAPVLAAEEHVDDVVVVVVVLRDDGDEIRPSHALPGLLCRRLACHHILPDLAVRGPDPPTTALDLASPTSDGARRRMPGRMATGEREREE